MKAAIVVHAGGPILVLTSCGTIANPLFTEGMRAKGITKYIAYEVPVERCQELYHKYFRKLTEQLEQECSLGVLDFDGRRIFLNFPLTQLGEPVIVDDPRDVAA
jgi:hypothetical protein